MGTLASLDLEAREFNQNNNVAPIAEAIVLHTLPQRLLFRRPIGENGRLSLGSSFGYSEFYVDVNDEIKGSVLATYSQIEIKTGVMYEHRVNDYLIATFQGGLQSFISNRATEKGEPAKDFLYENKQDATGYFQIGLSIDPFSKKKK